MRKFGGVSSVLALLVALLARAASAHGVAENVRVLVVHGDIVKSGIDPSLKARLANAGFTIRDSRYQQLDPALLAAFQVVIVEQEPAYGQSFTATEERTSYLQKVPLLLQFVEQGGGLFVTHDGNVNSQPQDCDLINEALLKPLDAQILPDTVVDDATLDTHTAHMAEIFYASTTNVFPHQVTTGVRKVRYPLGYVKFGRDTSPLGKMGSEWTVVLSGNQTAISGGNGYESSTGQVTTYRASPPLAAVRAYGSGRVFLFPTSARIWLHSAYHPENAGYVYAGCDGMLLVTRVLRWLAEPGLRANLAPLPPDDRPVRARRLAAAARQAEDDASNSAPNPVAKPFRAYMGVVGVDATVGGAVHDYCEAAKRAGLSFVAFTNDCARMDAASYSRVVYECSRETTAGFVALPGVKFEADVSGRWLALNVPNLPTRQQVNATPFGPFDVMIMSEKTVTAPTQGHRPGGYPPFGLRFMRGVDAVACADGKVVDDSLDWYRRCAANMCRVAPLSSQAVLSPERLASSVLWRTGVFATDAEDIPQALSQGSLRSFISEGMSGPVIRTFSILPAGRRSWEQAALWKRGDLVTLRIDVAAADALRTVTLHWNRDVFRCFRPGSKEFVTDVRFEPAKDGSFWLELEDESGRRALSAPVLLLNRYKRFNWCTDHQNLIDWCYDPSQDKAGDLLSGIYCYDTVHSPGPGDSIGGDIPRWEINDVPPGKETGGSFASEFRGLYALPRIRLSDGRADNPQYRWELAFNSQDAYVLDGKWDRESQNPCTPKGAEYYTASVRIINPFARAYTPNFVMVDARMRALKDIVLDKTTTSQLIWLNASFSGAKVNRWDRYVALAPGGIRTGEARFDSKGADVPLARHGYVGLYPNRWYTPVIFAADDGAYVARTTLYYGTGGDFEVGTSVPSGLIVAGAAMEHRFVYAVDAGDDAGPASIDRIHRAYGLAGKPAYRVTLKRGCVLDRTFALTLRAQGHAVEGAIAPFRLPAKLTVIIRGLNPNWDAGIFNPTTGELRRFGTLEDTGYVTLDGATASQRFAAGNPVTCDQEKIRLTLIHDSRGWSVEAHNPTAVNATTTISRAEWATSLPAFRKRVFLPAGRSLTLKISARGRFGASRGG